MARAEIFAGICGFTSTVDALKSEDGSVSLAIQSDCKAIQRLGAELENVDPFREITFRREGPLTLQMAGKYCSHTACPVPSGIIKAVEVAAGLALPADVTIKLSK
jgi:hypothetical protein